MAPNNSPLFFPLSQRFVGRGWGEGWRRRQQSCKTDSRGATPHPIPLPEAGRGGWQSEGA